ncbi:hypothetical protein SK128_024706 [Halocaridina rubra]|uniref:CHK kinase-like domain-containing protein n=1 Tax=Halocaridina rubra TaxID=373956 RepID=A0AAN9A6M9_HALRR
MSSHSPHLNGFIEHITTVGNVQDVPATVVKTLIKEANLCEVLSKAIGSDSKLISWTIQKSVSQNDNYIAIITKVKITYSQNGMESLVSIVARLGPPRPSKVLNQSINYAFVKEARAYQELLPSLNSELTAIGMKPLRFPKCYYTSWEPDKEAIYLEDLRAEGYKSPGRYNGLDVAHSTLILQELARLHAASLLLEVRDSFEDLDSKYTFLEKDCFDVTEEAVKQTREVLIRYIDRTIAVLNATEGYERAAEWLNNLKPRVFEQMEKKLKTHTRFAVVCHGDCWSKNVLFRYNKKGAPVEVMLVDLQMVRRASLAVDLNYFFYNSLTGPDRQENLEKYLDIYYTSFKSVMQARGLAMPFIRAELDHEYKSKNLYGMLWAMIFVPLSASECIDIPDWRTVDESPTKGTDSLSALTNDNNMSQTLNQNPEVMARFLSLFDDMVGKADAKC